MSHGRVPDVGDTILESVRLRWCKNELESPGGNMKPSSPAPLQASRRAFLKQTLAASAVAACPAILHADEPNSSVQVVCVGANGMGFADMQNIASHAKVKYVGFCDVDTKRFDQADKLIPGVPQDRKSV